jgi:photosystem II stability/assembly factor-like uncharacterized protein
MLFKSPDGGGERWHLLPWYEGLFGPLATAPTRSGQVLVGGFNSVLRSVNGGRRWTSGEEIECAIPFSLAVNPTQAAVVYLGIDFIEVPCGQSCRTFKSVDAGDTWTCIGNGLPGGGGSRVAADPRRPGILYVVPSVQGEGLWRSEDDGASWSVLTRNFDPVSFAVSPSDPSFLYAGTFGVARSQDGGRTWSTDTQGLPADWVFSMAVDPVDPRTVYAGVYRRGVFRSQDGGATWASLGPGLEGLSITALLLDRRDPKTLYAGTLRDGVWVLTQE